MFTLNQVDIDMYLTEVNDIKNILYVYHRLNVIGGIETRWIDEFVYLKKHHIQVHLLINKNSCNSDLFTFFPDCKIAAYPFDDIDNATNFVNLVETLIDYIEVNEIDIVHIHMQNLFAFAAVIAAQLCQVPIISTTHGILELYQKPIETVLFAYIAQNSIFLNAYVSNLPYSAAALSNKQNKVIIPNLININKYKSSHKSNNTNIWLITTRISKEKFPSILKFIELAYFCKVKTIHIAGGGNPKPLLERINETYKEVDIEFLGERRDIPEILPDYALLAGMGRVALEGMACQIPVCIITPDGKLKGLVTPSNFHRLKSYNFTGNTLKTLSLAEFEKQLLTNPNDNSVIVYNLLKDNLSTDEWNHFIPLYKHAKFLNNATLNRLFHKITYFAHTFSNPFVEDENFHNLIYETLLQEKQDEIIKIFDFYKKTEGLGLIKKYPNPYQTTKKNKKIWKKYKLFFQKKLL